MTDFYQANSKPSEPYMTVPQSLMALAEKHRLRGEKYLRLGNFECAEGSFIKSFKKRRKALSFGWQGA